MPPTSAALAGSAALVSVELIATVSLVLTKFQSASTALTVTVKAVPAVWAFGDPVLPVDVPGTAVSPGSSSCTWVNAAALTVTDELVLAVMPACVVSEAVTVRPPAVLRVTLKFCVPATNAALLGKTALASLEVMATVSLVLIKFQFASTALTVTVPFGRSECRPCRWRCLAKRSRPAPGSVASQRFQP